MVTVSNPYHDPNHTPKYERETVAVRQGETVTLYRFRERLEAEVFAAKLREEYGDDRG